jgi:hypothetical protein
MGLGPDVCFARNRKLVYGRMTGWGQDGPLAMGAGHDINYISLSGVLHSIGRKGHPPTPPLVLTGDFGGGAMYLALGVLSAVIEARASGRGQVVDASMVDGSASLMTDYYGRYAAGLHNDERGTNVTDGGAWYFDAYRCADGKYVSVAPVEPKFRALLLDKLGLADRRPALDDLPNDEARDVLQSVFVTRTRDQWCELLEGSDACFAPVLSLAEAPRHPHNVARGTFVEVDGIVQPAPAPRFSRTPVARPPNRTCQARARPPRWQPGASRRMRSTRSRAPACWAQGPPAEASPARPLQTTHLTHNRPQGHAMEHLTGLGLRINNDWPRVDAALVDRFRQVPATVIGDAANRLQAFPAGFTAYGGRKKFAGPAFTVRVRPGDNLFVH